MVKLVTTFLKFTEFIRETAQKVNISELEGMYTLTSPRVNKTPKKKLEEGSSLSTSAKDGDNPEPDPSSSSKSEHTGKKNSDNSDK